MQNLAKEALIKSIDNHFEEFFFSLLDEDENFAQWIYSLSENVLSQLHLEISKIANDYKSFYDTCCFFQEKYKTEIELNSLPRAVLIEMNDVLGEYGYTE